MAWLTSSWKTTVSPITMAPWVAGAKAAHDPSPANGLRGMPSTWTATSVRGQPMRTTPSGVVVAFAPAAVPILPASNLGPPSAAAPQGAAPPASSPAPSRPNVLRFMVFSFAVSGQEGDALGRLAHLGLAQRLHLARLAHLHQLQGAVAQVARQHPHRPALGAAGDALDAARVGHVGEAVEQLAGLDVHRVEVGAALVGRQDDVGVDRLDAVLRDLL